jgi:uncharacterized protein YggT (Ycf19 family)
MLLRAILQGFVLFFQALAIAMLVAFVLLWFFPPKHRLRAWVGQAFDPVLAPLRRLLGFILPNFPLDLSPLAVILILQLLRTAVVWLQWRVH